MAGWSVELYGTIIVVQEPELGVACAGPCLGSLGLGGMWSVVGGRWSWSRAYMVRTVLDAGGWSTPLNGSPRQNGLLRVATSYEAPFTARLLA
jgi:hypothetical protein